jgi:hypothetical protein
MSSSSPSPSSSLRPVLLLGASLTLPALASLAGCERGVRDVPVLGAIGRPAITVKNETAVAANVTVWTGERTGKTYTETWLTMRGRTERVQPGEETRFYIDEYESKADPIVRVEVKPRGPSFEGERSMWFEVTGKPPFNAKLAGLPGDFRFDSTAGRIVRIPDNQVMARERRLVNQQDRQAVPTKSGEPQ